MALAFEEALRGALRRQDEVESACRATTMMSLVRAWRFVTLLLAALALTMTSAHVLELPPEMRYDVDLYATVNGSLYRYFASVGAIYTLGSISAAFLLAFLLRGRHPAFGWTLAGAIGLLLGFASWLALVAPVNQEVAAAYVAVPASVPALWLRLRPRWKYGHATGFVLQLAGFCALLASILVETAGPSPLRGRSGAEQPGASHLGS